MNFIVSILVGVLFAGVKAAVDMSVDSGVSDSPLKGYTVVPFSMTGAIEPSGEMMTFNGTVTEILAQIQGIKPGFKWDDFLQPDTPSTSAVEHNEKRYEDHYVCNPACDPGNRFNILYGYDYLKQINKNCGVDGGPRKCAMVFCRYGSAIWMCNDQNGRIQRSCSNMAEYVLELIGKEDCLMGQMMDKLRGQVFDTDRFNIIVGGHDC